MNNPNEKARPAELPEPVLLSRDMYSRQEIWGYRKEHLTAYAERYAAAASLVPGVMRCAKCSFQLNRVTLYVGNGAIGAGDNKTEPCPNGCGPLWPVTWKQWADEAYEYAAAETKRAELAEGQRDAWQLSCWTARDERDAETKRADALAVMVKELEAKTRKQIEALNFLHRQDDDEEMWSKVDAILSGDAKGGV